MVVTQPDSRRESFNVSQRYAEIGMKAVERALQFHAMDADADGQLVIDDLVATGGTLSSAIELVQMAGGVVVECACIVELKFLIPSRKELYEKVRIGVQGGFLELTHTSTSTAQTLLSNTPLIFFPTPDAPQLGISGVPIWALISEDVLTNEAELGAEYKDDGEEH